MKRVLVLLSVLVVIVMAGCNPNGGSNLPDPSVNAPEINTEAKFTSMDNSAKQQFIGLVHGELTTSSDFSRLINEATSEVITAGSVTKRNAAGTLTVVASFASNNISVEVAFDGYSTGDYTFWGTAKNVATSQIVSSTVRVDA